MRHRVILALLPEQRGSGTFGSDPSPVPQKFCRAHEAVARSPADLPSSA